MAKIIATVALIILIIVIQHLMNWAVRKAADADEPVLGFVATLIALLITYYSFYALIKITSQTL